MGKILVIAVIILVLFFLITRKFSRFQFNTSTQAKSQSENIEITVPTVYVHQLLKKVLFTVGTGFILLLFIVVIASKFKIALILLPVSFYLIGQFFVFNNHLKSLKNTKMTYHRSTNSLTIATANNKKFSLQLNDKNMKVKEVKSVQKNNGLLMGYFEISSAYGTCNLPFIAAANPESSILFDKLKQSSREVETKLFPII